MKIVKVRGAHHVLYGEVHGTSYRASFEGCPNTEDIQAIEELVSVVKNLSPEELERLRDKGGRASDN